MNYTISIVILYAITIVTVLWLLYLLFKKEKHKIQIYNEIPPPPQIETHHWGYAWRPWWRRYGGVTK